MKKDNSKFFIEYWWDKYQKYWVIIVYDDKDVQLEEISERTKSGMESEVKRLGEKYNTDDFRKISLKYRKGKDNDN